MASKKAAPVEVLPEYSCDCLKELCRNLELDGSGHEEATLVVGGAEPPSGNGASCAPAPIELNLGESSPARSGPNARAGRWGWASERGVLSWEAFPPAPARAMALLMSQLNGGMNKIGTRPMESGCISSHPSSTSLISR